MKWMDGQEEKMEKEWKDEGGREERRKGMMEGRKELEWREEG